MDINGIIRGGAAAQRTLKQLEKPYRRAGYRAINRVLGKQRTEGSKRIRQQVALKAGYVRDRLTIRKAREAKPEGAIQTPSRGVLLSRFKVRQLRRKGRRAGLAVKVKAKGSAKTMRGAFLVKLPNGVDAVAIRERGQGRRFRVLYGPSVSQVFTAVSQDMAPQALAAFRTTYARQLEYELSRLRGTSGGAR